MVKKSKERLVAQGFAQYKKKPVKIWAKEMVSDFVCATLEGTMKGHPGDYLIYGIKGEPYPCKPDIFKKTYAKVKK